VRWRTWPSRTSFAGWFAAQAGTIPADIDLGLDE
jgi:hypothetical protein